MKAALGAVLVGAHVAAFIALAPAMRGSELVVDVTSPLASPTATLHGELPEALRDRVQRTTESHAPGLLRQTWRVRYRGGFERAVGATQLVGPFQDPAGRACVGRVVVGQRLLDAIAGTMGTQIDAELRGLSIFGLGDYRRVRGIKLQWATLDKHRGDWTFIGAAPHGYVRVEARLVFDRVEIPLVVALVPKPSTTSLDFRIATRAQLDFGNRVLQWASDKVGGNDLATRFARREIDAGILTTLAPPPPFELPDGQRLTFGYCGGNMQIVDGTYGALPFAVSFAHAPDAAILPPRRGPAQHAVIDPTAALAIDLDLDALNALLHELWRTGFLDRRLAAAGLERRFNEDATVTEFLSLRLARLRLALPPVLHPHGTALRLAAESRVEIRDGAQTTIGRVWGGLDFRFGAALEPVSVDLGALELTCERTPTRLVPCFADLVGAVRDRGGELHGELTQTFAGLLTDIFVDQRIGGAGLPAELVLERVRPRLHVTDRNAALHLDLDAKLVAPL